MDEARAKALVVDDEESIRSVLHQALTDAGLDVLTAESGLQALDVLSRSEIEVMLLDIRMPGMSGLEVLSKVQAQSPDTCVILVTAISEVGTAVAAMKQGAYDYVDKPFDLDDVIKAVQRAIEHRTSILRDRRDERELQLRPEEQAAAMRE